jgi:hypothetical protein
MPFDYAVDDIGKIRIAQPTSFRVTRSSIMARVPQPTPVRMGGFDQLASGSSGYCKFLLQHGGQEWQRLGIICGG